MRIAALAVAFALAAATGSAHAASPVVVDANGKVLGFFLGKHIGQLDQVTELTVITTRGFAVSYSFPSGVMKANARDPWGGGGSALDEIYFASANCTGVGHFEYPSGSKGGGVGRASSGIVYFVPKNEPGVQFVSQSRRNRNGVCEIGNLYPGPFVEAMENNSAVTGVDDELVVPPLRIEVVSIEGSSYDVFRDGFELPQV